MDPESKPTRVTPLPIRNDLHYDSGVFERVDWSKRGAYMQRKHHITPEMASDALSDADRVLIDPDYNSTSGKSVRIIGYSIIADAVLTVIVVEHEGIEYGVNGWPANSKDRHIYSSGTYETQEGETDEQDD